MDLGLSFERSCDSSFWWGEGELREGLSSGREDSTHKREVDYCSPIKAELVREKLDRRFVKAIHSLSAIELETIASSPSHRCRNSLEEVLYGYKSVMTSERLFGAIDLLFQKGDIVKYRANKIACLSLINMWIGSELYRDDYELVSKKIENIIASAKKSHNALVSSQGKKLHSLWKAENSELKNKKRKRESSLPVQIGRGSIECYSMLELIIRCDYKPKAVAGELSAFITSVYLEVTVSDLFTFNNDTSDSLSRGRKNSLLRAAHAINKLTHLIIYDLLMKESRADRERRYEFYLYVAMKALKNCDTSTAMLLFTALNNSLVSKLTPLGQRPSYVGFKEQIGFNKRKKVLKYRYDKKIDMFKELRTKCSFAGNFSNLRFLERKSLAAPHVLSILASDLTYAQESPVIVKDDDGNLVCYNSQRVAIFAQLIKKFAFNQGAMRETRAAPAYSIGQLIEQSDIKEAELAIISLHLLQNRSIVENFHHCSGDRASTSSLSSDSL